MESGKVYVKVKEGKFFEPTGDEVFSVKIHFGDESVETSGKEYSDGKLVWEETLNFSVDKPLDENSTLIFSVFNSGGGNEADPLLVGKGKLEKLYLFTPKEKESRELLIENPGLVGNILVIVWIAPDGEEEVVTRDFDEPSDDAIPVVRDRGNFNFNFGVADEPSDDAIPVVRDRGNFNFNFDVAAEPAPAPASDGGTEAESEPASAAAAEPSPVPASVDEPASAPASVAAAEPATAPVSTAVPGSASAAAAESAVAAAAARASAAEAAAGAKAAAEGAKTAAEGARTAAEGAKAAADAVRALRASMNEQKSPE